MHWRGGPRPKPAQVYRILNEFNKKYKIVIQKSHQVPSNQKVMDEIYKELCEIDGLGPKIVGVCLRDIVCHFGIWPHLTNYLYLPIDRHTRSLLVERIKAFESHEVPKVSEPYFTKKNQAFQKQLDRIHRPRVEFDYFWHIGSQFCSYFLCPQCWIRKFCMNKIIEDEKLPL